MMKKKKKLSLHERPRGAGEDHLCYTVEYSSLKQPQCSFHHVLTLHLEREPTQGSGPCVGSACT